MKQKIADLERLRALELSVYGEGPSLSPPRRQLSPPRNVLSQRYVPIRDQPPPGDTRDEYLREPRRLSHTPNGQDARGNSGNIQEMQDIRNNGHHRNMHEFRGAPDESNYRPGQIEQVPSHGPRFEDRNGSRPIGGFRGQGGVSHATVSDRQSHQFMPPLDNDRNTSFTVRNGNQSIMSGAQDRGPAHFPENKGFPPRDSRNPEWDQKVNRKEDPPRGNFQTHGGGPNRPLDQRYPGASQDRPRIHANPISGLDGIPPARGHGPPARMGYQAPRGRR
ncbi:hypothetical protein QFC19_000654 [Naganishia cerealis]|uniref:Uncharacterized protein n=1 Tax=Naganishia cerealis TaxID=610337 RepID=A0ACC2WNA3_9TREE|nr:hypothetical protein QFC19_000654 [Naganishia cerealis]